MSEPIYQKMYTTLFNAITDALAQLEAQDLPAAQETLRQAQQTAEDLYLEAPCHPRQGLTRDFSVL